MAENELKWRFRRNHQEDDFGIDGYVGRARRARNAEMIWITPKERMAFLERHFHSLNRFTKRHSIPLAVNKKISHAIGRIVVGDEETGIQQ